MSDDLLSRRRFVKDSARVGAAALIGVRFTAAEAKKPRKLHLACNVYPWIVFYQREGRDFNASLDPGLADVAASGFDGFEPIINAPPDVDRLAPLLKKHGLQMRSLYVNSTLHEQDKADDSIKAILAIADKAKKTLGTRIIVTNPSPIRWGGQENKDDSQLEVQAAAMQKLGRQLNKAGLILAYHNHDVELRNAAREFHHMMVGTDPKYVTLCLDGHWIYRGAGNSAVALFDVLKLYGPRVTELHLRQSRQNIWSETLDEGDIDYERLARYLLDIGVRPHMVMEQAVEDGTPKTMGNVEAFRRSSDYARRIFARFAG